MAPAACPQARLSLMTHECHDWSHCLSFTSFTPQKFAASKATKIFFKKIHKFVFYGSIIKLLSVEAIKVPVLIDAGEEPRTLIKYTGFFLQGKECKAHCLPRRLECTAAFVLCGTSALVDG